MNLNTLDRNTRTFRLSAALVVAATALFAPIAHAGAGPQPTDDGKTLVVPAADAARGTVYYVVPGKPGPSRDQTRFTNNPPSANAPKLATFTGFSNGSIGYIIVSSDEPMSLITGEFLMPVDSLDTGVKMRNAHLGQKSWLDIKNFDTIFFSLRGVRNMEEKSNKAGATTYAGEIFGVMTLKGVAKEFSFPATITHRPQSDATRALAKGDLIAVRARYDISLSDFGISNGVIGDKVANKIALEQFLIFSTEKPF